MYNPQTGSVSKRLESIVQTGIKTGHTTYRRSSVSMLFNALHVVMINYKYFFNTIVWLFDRKCIRATLLRYNFLETINIIIMLYIVAMPFI
jgi:hypothetical protein